MPLPDPHADEPTVELDRDLYKLYLEAVDAVDKWTRELKRRRERLEQQIGNAYAGTVDGQKVITYRPTATYATTSLIKAYPDLTAHFFKRVFRDEFQMDDFAEAHPDIATQYQSRSFRRVDEK